MLDISTGMCSFQFGGGFEIGDTSQYVPTELVERSIAIGQPVIYVSANYRLNGVLFLSSFCLPVLTGV